ncbi:MAG: carboxypeptidase regulatory-like domain-containing protein [Patescibacteria group bacterium]
MRHVRKSSLRILASATLAMLVLSFPGIISPARAVVNVVTGTVSTSTGTAMSGVTIQLHTPDGIFSTTTVTDGTGAYHFDNDLTNGTPYVVEATTPTGYNRSGEGSYNFTYAGVSQTGKNFTFVQTTKTITGTVRDNLGNLITDADINIDPYNITGASRLSNVRTNGSGVYTATMVGGTWFAQPVVNLSEYTPTWISEVPPTRVDFATDTTVESQTFDFVVTHATGKVSVILLNSDSSKLTSSNFVADINFRRADGVGTMRKVRQADSGLSVYLTPGIYSISAFHSDLNGKSFDPAATTFVMTENGNVDLGTVLAQVNSGHLKGKVTTTKGAAIPNVSLLAVREGGSERVTGNTDPSGNFDFTVGAGTWTIGLNAPSGKSQYSQVMPATATVANGQTVTGLNIQMKTIDRTISGNVVNSAGTKVTDFIGSAYVRTSNNKVRVSATVVDGAFSIDYASAELAGTKVIVGVQAAPGADFAGGAEKQVTITGASATQNLTLRAYDAVMSGALKLKDGTTITSPGSDIQVVALDADGNFTSTTVAADGTYSLPLAAGTWLYDYDIENPELTNALLNRPAGQNSVTVTAGQSVSKNITVLKGANTITGTVTDASGTAVQRALVVLDNRSTLENNAAANPNDIVTVTTETNETGVYTVKVPDGTYLVTVGETPGVAETQLPPDGKSVKVSGGSTTTSNLKFEATNATLKGTVKFGTKVEKGGTVTAFSADGSQVTGTVGSNGTYSLSVTSGEKWNVIVTDISGAKLTTSEVSEVTPKVGANTVNLTLKDSGITIPGPVTKSGSADDSLTIGLADGTSVSLPPFALGTSGNVSVTVTPTVDIDPTTMDRPASLAYEVKATDPDGREKKNLDQPATITLPYADSAVVNSGLREKGLATKFWDAQTETWSTDGATGLVDTKDNTATLTTTHLTKFSVTGTAKKKPTVSTVKYKSKSGSSMVLEITGTNFTSKVSAAVGTVKASKVQVKSAKSLLVTVPTSKLKNATYDMTFTNSDGRQTIKKITYSKGRVLGASVVRLIPR